MSHMGPITYARGRPVCVDGRGEFGVCGRHPGIPSRPRAAEEREDRRPVLVAKTRRLADGDGQGLLRQVRAGRCVRELRPGRPRRARRQARRAAVVRRAGLRDDQRRRRPPGCRSPTRRSRRGSTATSTGSRPRRRRTPTATSTPTRSSREPDHRWGKNGGNDREQHDLYNIGCLVEAGVHYYRATGKTEAPRHAVRAANGMCKVMGPPPQEEHHPRPRDERGVVGPLYELFREHPA